MTNDFKDIILNRRSIRKYKKDQKVSNETIKAIFELALRAPSANNLQPWHFRVIASDEAKATYSHLFPWNRSQYETSAFMVIIFVDKGFALNAEAIYDKQVSLGTMTTEVRDRQLASFKLNQPDELSTIKTAYLDAGLLAMNLMLSARSFGLDTCPIGGFNKKDAPIEFNLSDKEAVMAISFGVKDDEGYTSIRLTFDEVGKIY